MFDYKVFRQGQILLLLSSSCFLPWDFLINEKDKIPAHKIKDIIEIYFPYEKNDESYTNLTVCFPFDRKTALKL